MSWRRQVTYEYGLKNFDPIAMRQGGKRVAVIRPEAGYGSVGNKKAGINKNTTFLIRLHLIKCFLV